MNVNNEEIEYAKSINIGDSKVAIRNANEWMDSQIAALKRSIHEIENLKQSMEKKTNLQEKANCIEWAVDHIQQSIKVSNGVRCAGQLQAAHATQTLLDNLDNAAK